MMLNFKCMCLHGLHMLCRISASAVLQAQASVHDLNTTVTLGVAQVRPLKWGLRLSFLFRQPSALAAAGHQHP